MNHVVLLGDSIFDNAAYVAGGPDVVRQLRDILPSGWRATLNALDGAVMADVPQQLQKLPGDASHLVVSVGGNDALGEASLLDRKVGSMAEALALITEVRERFRSAYARMLDQALERRYPLAVCTIYEPRFPEPMRRSLTATALTGYVCWAITWTGDGDTFPGRRSQGRRMRRRRPSPKCSHGPASRSIPCRYSNVVLNRALGH